MRGRRKKIEDSSTNLAQEKINYWWQKTQRVGRTASLEKLQCSCNSDSLSFHQSLSQREERWEGCTAFFFFVTWVNMSTVRKKNDCCVLCGYNERAEEATKGSQLISHVVSWSKILKPIIIISYNMVVPRDKMLGTVLYKHRTKPIPFPLRVHTDQQFYCCTRGNAAGEFWEEWHGKLGRKRRNPWNPYLENIKHFSTENPKNINGVFNY